jgi:hypothetical protein
MRAFITLTSLWLLCGQFTMATSVADSLYFEYETNKDSSETAERVMQLSREYNRMPSMPNTFSHNRAIR